jgi:LmbE family N-acetylglucosaminyl deacetylase
LAIAAHPDDAEFGCGATLAKWSAAGSVVNHLVLTDGSKGSWDPSTDTAALVATRQAEQRAAAAALGSRGEVVFLGYTDGELESGREQQRQVAYWIRRLRPDVVLGHDPWKRYRLHPDHRHAGLLACEGIVAARDPHFYTDLEVAPWRPSTLLLWEADEVHHIEDVTGFTAPKLAALLAHESQLRSTMHVDISSPDGPAGWAAFERRTMDRLADHGRQVGVAHGEAFARVDDL